jgi:hypothetical protein
MLVSLEKKTANAKIKRIKNPLKFTIGTKPQGTLHKITKSVPSRRDSRKKLCADGKINILPVPFPQLMRKGHGLFYALIHV